MFVGELKQPDIYHKEHLTGLRKNPGGPDIRNPSGSVEVIRGNPEVVASVKAAHQDVGKLADKLITDLGL